ncbi:MAG TPA: hypothetical protein VGF82_08535 [Terracidiphilus sp.]|jgi:hypothetical protein
MKDSAEIKRLETQVALDQQKYDEVEREEAELLDNIPPQGFGAFPAELKYRSEKEALEESMHVDKQIVAGLESQPD